MPSVVSVVGPPPGHKQEAISPPHLQANNIRRHVETKAPSPRSPSGELKADENIQYLVKLLRQPPPPGNYMSTPYNHNTTSSEGKVRRSKLFHKEQKHHDHLSDLALPPSTVPAKTVGGYRHIAISIPPEYSYLNLIPGSLRLQYLQLPMSLEVDFRREIDRRFSSYGYSESTRSLTAEGRDSTVPGPFMQMDTEALDRRALIVNAIPRYREVWSRSTTGFQTQPDQGNELYQEPDTENEISLPPRMSKVREELDEPTETEHPKPRNKSTAGHTGATRTHTGSTDKLGTYPSMLPIQQSRSKSAQPTLGSSVKVATPKDMSRPSGRIKMIPPPWGHTDKKKTSRKVHASLDARMLSAKPMPGLPDAKIARADRKPLVATKPPSQQEPNSPKIGATQSDTYSIWRYLRHKERPDKPGRTHTMPILLRFMRWHTPDQDAQSPKPVSQYDCTESPVAGHSAHGTGVVSKVVPAPLESCASRTPNQDSQGRDGDLSRVSSISRASEISSSGRILSSSRGPSTGPALPSRSPGRISSGKPERQQEEAADEGSASDHSELEEQSVTDSDWLSLRELVLKLENLREARLDEIDKRLGRLEEHGETLLRSVVPLMETLSTLLEEQNSLLRSIT